MTNDQKAEVEAIRERNVSAYKAMYEDDGDLAITASLDDVGILLARVAELESERADLKATLEKEYIASHGDKAMQHVAYHAWELDTAIKIRDARVLSLTQRAEAAEATIEQVIGLLNTNNVEGADCGIHARIAYLILDRSEANDTINALHLRLNEQHQELTASQSKLSAAEARVKELERIIPGPSSTDYEEWLAYRPDIQSCFVEYPGFTKHVGYEIWRNAWQVCKQVRTAAEAQLTAENKALQGENNALSAVVDELRKLEGGQEVTVYKLADEMYQANPIKK